MALDNIYVLIGIIYVSSLVFGYYLQKYAKIPWVFSALFLGIIFSLFDYFTDIIHDEPFKILANLGMLMLLFLIGFNLELSKIKKLKNKIISGTIFIILLEGLFGTLLIYLVFPAEVYNSLLIAAITAFSFATVGEVILLPILKEFKVLKTTFGQLTLGIGTADDVIEIILLILISFLFLSPSSAQVINVSRTLISLISIFIIAILLIKFKHHFNFIFKKVKLNHSKQLIMLVIFFSFLGIGEFAFEGIAPIAAILAGLVSREILPKHITTRTNENINFLGYIFLAPLFFLSIGAEVSPSILIVAPFLVLAIWFVAKGSKLLASFILFRKLLGTKFSLLMGLGLSIRFSTSLIILYILLNEQLITTKLFSALILTAILMKPVIISVYSYILSRDRPI